MRALQNIIFKLDHDLLCIGDVVHKKELLIKLLEWFNFDLCSREKDVLQLLDKLSKVEFSFKLFILHCCCVVASERQKLIIIIKTPHNSTVRARKHWLVLEQWISCLIYVVT